jgi:predicted esterase
MIIGYSQGTTVTTYALSEKHVHLNDKISLFVALGPSILFKNSDEPMYKKMS